MSRDDQRHQLDMDRFAEGFTEDGTIGHIVPADSPLGRSMREARQAWARDGKPDPDAFDFGTPEPVED